MVGRRAEKHHSSRVGKNWVMIGFCSKAEKKSCYMVQQLLCQQQVQLSLLMPSPQHCDCHCTLSRLSTSLMVRLTGSRDQ